MTGHWSAPVVREYDAKIWEDDVPEQMTAEQLKAEMHRRLGEVAVPMMAHDAYLKAAVDAMFAVVAEHVAKISK